MNKGDLMQATSIAFGRPSFARLATAQLPPPAAPFASALPVRQGTQQAVSSMDSQHELLSEHVRETIGHGFTHDSLLSRGDPRKRRPKTSDQERDKERDGEQLDTEDCD